MLEVSSQYAGKCRKIHLLCSIPIRPVRLGIDLGHQLFVILIHNIHPKVDHASPEERVA